ncbi:MAG: FkbM family methyltransferase [Candidatus Nanohaloarchaea archaeon]
MSDEHDLAASFSARLKMFYRNSGLMTLFTGLGLHDTLSKIYRRIFFSGRRRRKTIEVSGRRAVFKTTTGIERDKLEKLMGEREVIEDFLHELDKNDVFWDVGANIGVYSLLAAAEAESVYAFEPHPLNYSRLQENIDLNNSDVEAIQAALSDRDGPTNLSVDGEDVGFGTHSLTSDSGREIEVRESKGGTLISEQGLAPPTVVKIDVEGAEEKVLSGMAELLEDCRLVYCEAHDQEKSEGVAEMLESLNFDVKRMDTEKLFLRAERNPDV